MISTALPFALGVIMFGLGLSLTVTDFRRAASVPRVVVTALLCQAVVLPLLCLLLVTAVGLPKSGDAGPLLAVGMMLLAASPGGPVASVFSHLFNGDVALNVTLLAINSVLSVVTLPVIVNFSMRHFTGASGTLGLHAADTLRVVAIVLVPIALGMWVRHRHLARADRLDRPVRIGSIVILVAVLAGAWARQGEQVLPYLTQMVSVASIFVVVNLTIGYAVPRLLRAGHRASIACAMEIGVHNEALAVTVALSLLGEPLIAVAPACYALLKYPILPVFGWLITRAQPTPASEPQAIV